MRTTLGSLIATTYDTVGKMGGESPQISRRVAIVLQQRLKGRTAILDSLFGTDAKT